MENKLKATCSSCGQEHEITVMPGINVGNDPELKAKVKDGSLFVWECPCCGKKNLSPFQTIYHDPDGKVMIWLLPPGSIPEDRLKALEAQMEGASEALEGYIFRRVADAGSLVEKVNILDSGLEDTVIEMCKYVTKMELAGKGGGEGILSAPFKFFRMDGPDNDLCFTYPSDGNMQVVQVGFNVYEDCAGILRRNPSIKPSGAFPSVDQDWISGFFR